MSVATWPEEASSGISCRQNLDYLVFPVIDYIVSSFSSLVITSK